jgi:hypothetical protein
LLYAPGLAVVQAALEDKIVVTNIADPIVAFLTNDEDITVRSLNDGRDPVVRFVS